MKRESCVVGRTAFGNVALIGLAQADSFATSTAGRHHEGPRNPFDYVLVAIAIVIVFVVAVLCVKFFIRPGEKDPDHIKRKVLSDR